MTVLVWDHGYPLISIGDAMTTPSTEAGRALVREIPEDADGYIDPEAVREAILDIERQAATLALADVAEKVGNVRRWMIDAIGVELSREFAQGNPFEPFDRTYVVKTITRVLDEARARLDALEESR
jgi:hypothetical protein